MGSVHLSIRNVVKSYDGRSNAVDGVDLDIQRGEFMTFLGPSGSGKTTMLMMVAGFETPQSGSILLGGDDLVKRKPYERNIGVVFQNYALFPHMTVAQNVAYPLKVRGVPKAEIKARVAEVLDLVSLGKFLDRYPKALSGGQQQRVALARGLVFKPDVLLLDEPLGALDKNLREQMQVEIKRIHRNVGITMIYVTHDQAEAMAMSDRIAVFSNGRIEQVAPPADVYHRPVSRFVGTFIGDSNILQGSVDPREPGRMTVPGLGSFKLPGLHRGDAKDIELLIRPERLRLVGDRDEGMNVVDFDVETIVDFGESVLAIGQMGGQTLRLRIPGSAPADLREGARVKIGWAPDQAHVLGHPPAAVALPDPAPAIIQGTPAYRIA